MITVAERLWVMIYFVKALLLVSIGGGVPTTKIDMLLGGMLVSYTDGKYGGVVHYGFGRFEHTGALNSLP